MICQKKLKNVIHDDQLASHPLWNAIFLQLGNVPVTIAPECKEKTLLNWNDVTLKCCFAPHSFQAVANTTFKTIRVDSGLVDGLWCMAVGCYALSVYYEQQSKSKDLTKESLVLDPETPEINVAYKYLYAALSIAQGNCAGIRPVVPKLSESLYLGARQLTLSTMAFVLYHEFAHIFLKHSHNSGKAPKDLEQSRIKESEADNFALDFILGTQESVDDSDAREISFRAWGAIVATLLFSANEMSANVRAKKTPGLDIREITDRTHPISYMRLDRVLKHNVVASNTLVRKTMYAATCIPLYFLAVVNEAISDQHAKKFYDIEALYEEVSNMLHEQLAKMPKDLSP